jgi:DNA-binding MarR family transcriptional regulator
MTVLKNQLSLFGKGRRRPPTDGAESTTAVDAAAPGAEAPAAETPEADAPALAEAAAPALAEAVAAGAAAAAPALALVPEEPAPASASAAEAGEAAESAAAEPPPAAELAAVESSAAELAEPPVEPSVAEPEPPPAAEVAATGPAAQPSAAESAAGSVAAAPAAPPPDSAEPAVPEADAAEPAVPEADSAEPAAAESEPAAAAPEPGAPSAAASKPAPGRRPGREQFLFPPADATRRADLHFSRRISDLIRRLQLMERETKKGQLGLTLPQAHALHALEEAGSLRMQELAGALGLAQSTVTRLVAPLKRMGLLDRRPDRNDGRATRAFLTDSGRRSVDELEAAERRMYEALLQRLPATRRAEVVAAIELLHDAVLDASSEA